jgi:hypothetical protein
VGKQPELGARYVIAPVHESDAEETRKVQQLACESGRLPYADGQSVVEGKVKNAEGSAYQGRRAP